MGSLQTKCPGKQYVTFMVRAKHRHLPTRVLLEHKSRCPEQSHSLQLPPESTEAVLLSISQCRGKMVSDSALNLLAFVIHRLSLKVIQAHCIFKENQDPTKYCSFYRNKIELSVGLRIWPMLEWVITSASKTCSFFLFLCKGGENLKYNEDRTGWTTAKSRVFLLTRIKIV